MIVDRGEFFDALKRLDAYYRSPDGLQRPEGLSINGQPDLEAIAAWILDVYLNAREQGMWVEAAWQLVIRSIEATDEWQQKHRQPVEPPAPAPEPSPNPPAPGGSGTEHGRLAVQDQFFVDEGGQQRFLLGVIAWQVLQRWLGQGEAGVAPLVDWMIASGFSYARIAGMYWGAEDNSWGLGHFNPQMYGHEYFDAIHDLGVYGARRGIRWKLDVLLDCVRDEARPNNPLVMINQPDFFAQVAAEVQGLPAYLLGGGNEWPKNGWRPEPLRRPIRVLASRGSGLGGDVPPANPWDFADVHPDRGGSGEEYFPRKAHDLYDIRLGNTGVNPDGSPKSQPMPVPIGCDESIGIGEQAVVGRTTTDASAVFDFVACCVQFGDFCTLLLRDLDETLNPERIGPHARACVAAAAEAVQVTPVGYKLGLYRRGGLLGPGAPSILHQDRYQNGIENLAGATRTFDMEVDGQHLVVVIQPGPAWHAIEAPGHQILSQRGPRGTVLVVR